MGISLIALSSTRLDNAGKISCFSSLPVRLFSGFFFHHVAEVSYLDSGALPELFLFLACCFIIDLCQEMRTGVSYIAILVIALWGLFFISFLEMTN